jgi:hypothetical protein
MARTFLAVAVDEARTAMPRPTPRPTENFTGGHDWAAEHGAQVTMLDDPECTQLLGTFIAEHPELWHEDIGL